MSRMIANNKDPGIGVGLRVPHYHTILEQTPPMDFFEIISENFMVPGGNPLYHLDRILERYPVVQHGVSLGLGSPSPPSVQYLKDLKRLTQRVKPAYLSDHFCWTQGASAHLHDLLPLPLTYEMAERLASRARALQDYLEVPFALENTSTGLRFACDQMSEWDFVRTVAEEADIGLLLDVNNVFVSAYNHGFDAYDFLRGVPPERVVAIHVAGHTNYGDYIIDSHTGTVIDAVWELYQAAIASCERAATVVEWDEGLTDFDALSAVASEARHLRTLARADVPGQRARLQSGRLSPHPVPAQSRASSGLRHG